MTHVAIQLASGDVMRLALKETITNVRGDLADQIREGAVVMVTAEGPTKIIPSTSISYVTITGAR